MKSAPRSIHYHDAEDVPVRCGQMHDDGVTRIVNAYNVTDDKAKVTCKRCLQLLGLVEVKPRAKKRTREQMEHDDCLRWVGFIEQAAAKGYRYDNGVAKCAALKIERFPELHERFKAALASLESDEVKRAGITHWLLFVEKCARKGEYYEKGVGKCIEMGIGEFPDLDARLQKAVQATAS